MDLFYFIFSYGSQMTGRIGEDVFLLFVFLLWIHQLDHGLRHPSRIPASFPLSRLTFFPHSPIDAILRTPFFRFLTAWPSLLCPFTARSPKPIQLPSTPRNHNRPHGFPTFGSPGVPAGARASSLVVRVPALNIA